VPARRIKNHAAQRDYKDITSVDSRMTDDTDEHHHWGQQEPGRHVQERANGGGDETGMLGNADAQHGDQHGADGAEADEVCDHIGQKGRHAGPGQLVDDHDGLTRPRIDHGERDIRQQPRQHPDDEQQSDKKHCRIG
jgi:hypothetical protein